MIFAASVDWLALLSGWALLAGIAYLGLIVLIMTIVMPAAKPSALPQHLFELSAAGKKPWLYRLAIGFDVAAWIALGGLLISFAGLLAAQAPVSSLYIAALAAGLLAGLVGACLRLVATPKLGSEYKTANVTLKPGIVQSYTLLLGVINILFSVGGLLAGAAWVLVIWAVWPMGLFSQWILVLLGFAGMVSIIKGLLELITGKDWGPLGLLAGIAMIVSFFAVALR